MNSIEKLTSLFAKFPTIGKRTAGRFVFYLIHQPKAEIDELISAIQELKSSVKFCSFCFLPFENSGQGATLCHICSDTSRNNQILCVVEKEQDLLTIEQSKKYKGLYFILGSLAALKERIQTSAFSEIIIATNPTQEGKTTSVLIIRALKELPQFSTLKITHLATGLPFGGELEYADPETLESAFEGRK